MGEFERHGPSKDGAFDTFLVTFGYMSISGFFVFLPASSLWSILPGGGFAEPAQFLRVVESALIGRGEVGAGILAGQREPLDFLFARSHYRISPSGYSNSIRASVPLCA